jgi:hypothetical protein
MGDPRVSRDKNREREGNRLPEPDVRLERDGGDLEQCGDAERSSCVVLLFDDRNSIDLARPPVNMTADVLVGNRLRVLELRLLEAQDA